MGGGDEQHARGAVRGWREGVGENNLKAELNFSFLGVLGSALEGGQWLNGDVSRKAGCAGERPGRIVSAFPLSLSLSPALPARSNPHSLPSTFHTRMRVPLEK